MSFPQGHGSGSSSPIGDGIFNVVLYGAKGNGTTDDTASIRTCIAAAGLVNGTVLFPPGTYLVNETSAAQIFLVTKAFSIYAYGATLKLKSTIPNTVDVFHLAPTIELAHFSWGGLNIKPESGTPARYGIHFDTTNGPIYRCTFSDVQILTLQQCF